jgi:hypothetical protein
MDALRLPGSFSRDAMGRWRYNEESAPLPKPPPTQEEARRALYEYLRRTGQVEATRTSGATRRGSGTPHSSA